eukprot:CAMPEP_0196757408 /NCGR_PEP_ID=MMETSP1091-20130531/103648_1 /TAXON_ID=302021 /ORGANISM="Rhodomonas sp., Strain CCMP768" /LENGTH=154 /DNA_ID=CAMNT_0042106183 /DNA_START=64 /DNA_END=528 /DNA_ORIENTATION=+
MSDEDDQTKYISMKKAMESIRSPEKFMELFNKDEFGQTGKVKPYKCQKNCGFSGSFFEVAKHERTCTAGQQAMAVPMMRQMMPTVVRQVVMPTGSVAPQQATKPIDFSSLNLNAGQTIYAPVNSAGMVSTAQTFNNSSMPGTVNARPAADPYQP